MVRSIQILENIWIFHSSSRCLASPKCSLLSLVEYLKEAFGQEVTLLHQLLLRTIIFGKRSPHSLGNNAVIRIYFISMN